MDCNNQWLYATGGKGWASLLTAATATGAGAAVKNAPSKKAIQAVVSGSGAVTATILVEVSNNGTDWETLATITLSGTTRAHDGLSVDAPWLHTRANLTALTGTGATADVILAAQ